MNTIDATDLYEYLPHSNCKRCGEENCMAFAVKLMAGEALLSRCGPLRLKAQEQNLKALKAMLHQ